MGSVIIGCDVSKLVVPEGVCSDEKVPWQERRCAEDVDDGWDGEGAVGRELLRAAVTWVLERDKVI